MKCHDFERLWNERLDARRETLSERDPALDAHARACPSCQVIHARYQTLGLALRLTGEPPASPAGARERILAALAAPPDVLPFRPFARVMRSLGPLTIAASVLLAGFLAGRVYWRVNEVPVAAALPALAETSDPKPLTTLLADATAATLELAKETSSSASRLGRAVIDRSELEAPTVVANASPDELETVSRVLRRVGDHLQEGVQPLSGSARQAFGFLLGPALDDHGA